jgi:hypothetical protein
MPAFDQGSIYAQASARREPALDSLLQEIESRHRMMAMNNYLY